MQRNTCKSAGQSELTPCPQSGTGVHSWIMGSANRCRLAGISEAEAERIILERMTRPPSPRNEVEQAVRKAYSSNYTGRVIHGQAGLNPPVPITAIRYDPAKLKAAAERIAKPASWRHWLWERSPKRP